jgi:MutS domain V
MPITAEPGRPRDEYAKRVDRWSDAVAAGERQHLTVSNLRLLVFAAAAAVAWLTFRGIHVAWLYAPAAAFLALVAVHARVLQRNERAARAKRFYERGLRRLDGSWMGDGSDGAALVADHPFARDLDLVGPGSLFQFLSTARTEAGETTLAGWLTAPATIEEIRRRQESVSELAPRVDLREDLAVLAAEADVGRTSALAAWAAAGPAGFPAVSRVVLGASAVVTAIVVSAALSGWIASGPVIAWLVAHLAIGSIWRRQTATVIHRLDLAVHDLGLLTDLLIRIEREPFTSPKLATLHASLMAGGELPSRAIARLKRYTSALDSTHNMLFAPIAVLLLVRSQAAAAIDRWHATHGEAVQAWLAAVGELEALASFATYAYEHPADPFPTIVGEGARLDARGLAHPLIVEARAVTNDLALGDPGPRVLVVSGSNMSGKSTLLRAIGVNVALALSGAPVRAVFLTLTPLAIGTTLKIEDSLQEGHSRFYAEILRIRGIVERARGPLPVLFLLDEILHGTNSHDRRIGAEAIVRSLVSAGAIGLVTTHDLALTGLVAELGSRAANVHFEDRIVDGRMVFDYTMRPGIVERSNALELMRAVGLDV